MTVDRKHLLEPLDPPSGGVERFRTRLKAEACNANKGSIRTRVADWAEWTTRAASGRGFLRLAGAAAALALVAAVAIRLPLGSDPRERGAPPPPPGAAGAPPGTPAAADAAGGVGEPDAPPGRLMDAPELAWLLGRAAAPRDVSVTIDGEEANVVELPSSNPRIRVYMVASNGED